jgi:hypothetical protein
MAHVDGIKTFVKNGKVELEAPDDWPEGTEVLVERVSHAPSFGLSEEDWPSTQEQIAQHLSLMDQIEPLLLTPEEEKQWAAAREAQKVFEKTQFAEHADRLRRVWE